MIRRLAILSAAFAIVHGAAAADLEQRIQFADGLYARGLFDLARTEYEAFLKEAPPGQAGMDAAHFRLGECLRRLGDRVGAEKEFRHVFVSYPQSSFRFRAGFRRAEVFMEAGQDAAAIDLLDMVIAANPPEDIAGACWYYKGIASLKTDKILAAVSALQKVRVDFAGSEFWPYAVLKLGEMLVKDAPGSARRPEDEAQAIEYFRSVVAKRPTARVTAEALFQIAMLHFRRGEFDRSAESFRTLLADYPGDDRAASARLQAAWAAHNAGLFAEGLRYAETALRSAMPSNVRAEWLYVKGNCERQLMKNDVALATYAELLQRHPESEYANAVRYETALTLFRMGKFRDALRAMESVSLLPSVKKDVYWLRAECHAALNDADNAIQYYQLIVREFPRSDVAPDANYRLAYQLQTKGQYREASRHYNVVAVSFPTNTMAPQALFASAFCLGKVDLHAEAVRDLALLVEKYPRSKYVEESLYQKGVGEVRLGRDDAAAATFADLLKRFPATGFGADACYWDGVLRARRRLHKDAEACFRGALGRSPRPDLEREIRLQLALSLKEMNENAEAARLLQELLDTPLKDRIPDPLLQWLAEFWFDQKQPDRALAAARVLVERKTSPEWLQTGHGLSGRCLMAQGKKKEATAAFREALEAGGTTRFAGEAALRLGDLAMESKDYAEAEKRYGDAGRLSGDDGQLGTRAHAYAGLGRAALARGDLEKAVRFFLSVAILYDDPELVPECLFRAGETFERLGRAEDRQKALKELRERYPKSRFAGGAGAGG